MDEPVRKHIECWKRDMWDISRKKERERKIKWWNNTVQQRPKEKNSAYKKWQQSGREENREAHKDSKRVESREIAIAERRAWEKWSTNLNTTECKMKMFKIAKKLRKDKRNANGTNQILSRVIQVK